jgi:hypothetical protein
MCLTFTISIVIMAIGLLLSWWKGHRDRVQKVALSVTMAGGIALAILALIPTAMLIVIMWQYSINICCLSVFIPFVVLAVIGSGAAFSYNRQCRTGVVLVESRKQMLAIGSAFLILSSILFAGILFVPYGTNRFAYHVSIKPSSNGCYTVYLPTPLGDDGDYSEYSKQMSVEKGTANFSFRDTVWGKALIVHGRGSVSLGMTANQAYYRNGDSTLDDVYLSLFMNGSGIQKIYRVGLDPLSDVTNVMLKLSIEAGADGTFDGGSFQSGSGNSTVEKGWNTMNVTGRAYFYD